MSHSITDTGSSDYIPINPISIPKRKEEEGGQDEETGREREKTARRGFYTSISWINQKKKESSNTECRCCCFFSHSRREFFTDGISSPSHHHYATSIYSINQSLFLFRFKPQIIHGSRGRNNNNNKERERKNKRIRVIDFLFPPWKWISASFTLFDGSTP